MRASPSGPARANRRPLLGSRAEPGAARGRPTPAGWLRRRPSRRATDSVPTIEVGSSPASRAAMRMRLAAGRSPSAPTSWASSSRMVTSFVGSAGVATGLPHAARASASSPRVNGSVERRPGSLPRMPRAVTARICGSAHEAALARVGADVDHSAGRTAPAVLTATSASKTAGQRMVMRRMGDVSAAFGSP